jgi:hypothetical protein
MLRVDALDAAAEPRAAALFVELAQDVLHGSVPGP